MQANIEVGLFTVEPGQKDFRRESVLAVEHRTVRTGKQVLVIRSARKPAVAGIDPYNKWIDRNSDDNFSRLD